MRIGKRERTTLRVELHGRLAVVARKARVDDTPIFTSLQVIKVHSTRWRPDWSFNSSSAKSVAAKRRQRPAK